MEGSRWSQHFVEMVERIRVSSRRGGLAARFRDGISWNVAGAILNNGANFLTNIVIANLLGREIFGQYGMVQSTLLTFVGIAQAAGGITATKYVAEYRSRDKEKAGRVLGLCSLTTAVTGILATCLVLVSASWLAASTLKAPFLADPLRIASVVVFFTVVNAYQMGALAGLESYREWAFANGLQGIFQLGICSLLAWQWGLRGAVGGLLATSAVRWLLLHMALRRQAEQQGIALRYSGFWHERSILLRFALPAALSSLTAGPAIWLGNTFLVWQTGKYSELALFSAALNLKNVVMFLPLLLNNVGMSLLNNQRGENDLSRYRKVFWSNMLLTGIAAAGGAGVVGLFGSHFLRLYGKTFPEGYPVLLLLLCVAVVEALAMASYQVIQSEEKMWFSLLGVMLPRDVALVGAAYWLTPTYGARGLAFAYLGAWLLCGLVVVSASLKIGLTPRLTYSVLEGVPTTPAIEGDSQF